MIVRYVYGISAALLLAGGAATLSGIGPAGAQVAANDSKVMQSAAPRAGAPMSFADLTERLQPAVVNISTKQKVRVNNNPFCRHSVRRIVRQSPRRQWRRRSANP